MSKYYTCDEYQNKIKDFVCYRVPSFNLDTFIPWTYSFLNIYAEWEEFQLSNSGSEAELLEAGDVLFSVADICNCFQMSFCEVVETDCGIYDLSVNMPKYSGWSNIAILADMGAKNIRDGKEIDRPTLFYALHGIVEDVMCGVNNNNCKNKVDIAVILKMNVDKLQDRLNRNVIKGDGDKR